MVDRSFFNRLVEMAPGPTHDSPVMTCIKVPYDRGEAERVAGLFKQTAYRCPMCGRWHLTKHRRFKWTDKGRRR